MFFYLHFSSGLADAWSARWKKESQQVDVPKHSRSGKRHPGSSGLTPKIVEYLDTVCILYIQFLVFGYRFYSFFILFMFLFQMLDESTLSLHQLRLWLEDQFDYPLHRQTDLDLIRTLVRTVTIASPADTKLQVSPFYSPTSSSSLSASASIPSPPNNDTLTSTPQSSQSSVNSPPDSMP